MNGVAAHRIRTAMIATGVADVAIDRGVAATQTVAARGARECRTGVDSASRPAAEMARAAGETGCASAAKTAASDMRDATTAAATDMRHAAAAATTTATAAASRRGVNGGCQRNRQHEDRQPFDV
jgi:hypothetical protein